VSDGHGWIGSMDDGATWWCSNCGLRGPKKAFDKDECNSPENVRAAMLSALQIAKTALYAVSTRAISPKSAEAVINARRVVSDVLRRAGT
jgi:hypothetical protein